ncbi:MULTISPECIES: hypothetical protein [unclassified Streptomyces]|uniref:hypothetical protein n=1 Tax=unclassified Streptomyces TaxID=2593676 RepID=UPI001BE8C7D8|nr:MULTISPECIES: hypothetical protein [unclassified Streptomyces]MBT2408552.1 hypothetical protein [Streptomyces sp. ISL-21]MBT2612679.1 hypothetical protein [Streptomyces sp. ISL-87]
MRTRFYANQHEPLKVHFEIIGGERLISPGGWIDVEFAESEPPISVHLVGGVLILTQEGDGFMRVWDSTGREIDPGGE